MNREFLKRLFEKNQACEPIPSSASITEFIQGILGFLFPDFEKIDVCSYEEFEVYSESLKLKLKSLLIAQGKDKRAEAVCQSFFDRLPAITEILNQDIDAMFEGDPAARTRSEIIRSYPGFYAIASYRIANELLNLEVELIPRIISELAHSRTGIDIHPGARIGRHFCIDHGTGVVIGETTMIGDHVKIYQGVTLGGLSVDKADAEKKRHPTIGNRVVIYAGATILGGDTVIGDNSVIGGNVWLTRSVPPNTKVYYKAALTNNEGQTDIIEFK